MVAMPAVHAARNCVARKAAHSCASDHAAKAPMTDCAADRAAPNGSEHRTGRVAVTTASISLCRDGRCRQGECRCRDYAADFVQHHPILSDPIRLNGFAFREFRWEEFYNNYNLLTRGQISGSRGNLRAILALSRVAFLSSLQKEFIHLLQVGGSEWPLKPF